MTLVNDTIFALATAPGKSGVAVVRVSGPEVEAVSKALCGLLPEPRLATLKVIRDSDGIRVDQSLILYFP
jgi:tRNA modification GTPase